MGRRTRTIKDWQTKGYVTIPKILIFDAKMLSNDIKVYGTIRAHYNSVTGLCFPTIETIAEEAASTAGKRTRGEKLIAEIDLMFSHIDKNLAGKEFPEHNFVFTDTFKSLLRGLDLPEAT